MNIHELVLAWVRSLLTMPPSAWEDTLTRLERSLGESWSFRRLAVPRAYSVGARLRDGRELPLVAWREALGLDGPVEARVVDLGAFSAEDLPEHMAAAFANTSGQALAVRARGVPSVYTLQSVPGPQTLITTAQWVEFMRVQPHAQRIREAVAAAITESNEMNGRPAVSADQVEDYLLTPEGVSIFDFLGGDLAHQLQSTLRREGTRETVPESFRRFFRPSALGFQHRMRFSAERPDEYFPPDQTLVLKREATVHDFVALVDAQPWAPEIWTRLAESLDQEQGREGGERPEPLTAAGARQRLLGSPDDFWNLFVSDLMLQWQCVCQGHGGAPLVPEAQRPLVQTEYERQRARDPGFVPDEERLSFQDNPEPYTLLLLCELEGVPPGLFTPVPPAGTEREAFVGALREAQAFAEKEKSPFAEAFKLARFALETDAWQLGAEPLSPERREALARTVKDAGFSARAVEVLGRKVNVLSEFAPFQPSEQKLRGLLASSLANVFGGMGSWNDQFFDTPEAQEAYQDVSARLFQTLTALSVANLNQD